MIDSKRVDKLKNHRQLAFEARERCPWDAVSVILVMIGALGGGMKALKNELKRCSKSKGLLINL